MLTIALIRNPLSLLSSALPFSSVLCGRGKGGGESMSGEGKCVFEDTQETSGLQDERR